MQLIANQQKWGLVCVPAEDKVPYSHRSKKAATCLYLRTVRNENAMSPCEITYPLVNSRRFFSSSRFARAPIQPWNIVPYSSSSEWSGKASLYGSKMSAGSSGDTRQMCGMAMRLASATSINLSMQSAIGGPLNQEKKACHSRRMGLTRGHKWRLISGSQCSELGSRLVN